MKHLNKYLSLALALVLCLSLAACGESNEDYGDDGSDYNLYGVPDSFEGLVKDSEQMSNLYLYGGAWKGEDGGTLISDTNDDGDEVRFALYDAGEELTASGFIQFVPDYSSRQSLSGKRDLGRQVVGYYDPAKPECITENRPRKPVFGGAYCFLWAAFLLFFGIMTFTGQVSFS